MTQQKIRAFSCQRLSQKPLNSLTVWRYLVVVSLVLAFSFAFESPSMSQSQPSAGARQNFTLFGDLKVDESQAEEGKPLTFDVILYKGGNVIGRLRIGSNGRYRFMNLLNGSYYLAIEIENVEVARIPVLIVGQYADDIRQDLSLEWRPIVTRKGPAAGVISAADSYERSGRNKLLYQRSAREINSKNYATSITTLRELVASDANDFPAWFELGMVYFIQKDLEAAEKCFSSAVAAKPSYFPAMLNLGRVQLARKNYENAIASLETSLKVDPKSATANYFLGEAYLQLKKGTKGAGYLNEALRLDPIGMAEAHLRLARLYNLAGYKDKAVVEYEEFLKKQPGYPDRKKLEQYIDANKPKTRSTK